MRIPVFAPLVAAALLMPIAGASVAADVGGEHRRIQAAIDDTLPDMARATFEIDVPGAEVPPQVTAWMEDGLPRKVRVEHLTSHGPIVQEFYYVPGEDLPKLVFATQAVTTETADGKDHGTVRHRFFVQDGVLIGWQDDAGRPVAADRSDLQARSVELFDDSSMVLSALEEAAGAGGGASAEPGPVEETTGVFDGIEFGDYAHLMLTVGGEQQSFMILRPDASLERLLDNPDRYLGQALTVLWQTTTENIPEAGGPTEVTLALGVKGL